MSMMHLELSRETSTRKLYSDELQGSCEVPYGLRAIIDAYNVQRSLPAQLYVFITQSKKWKLRPGFNHVLITHNFAFRGVIN